MDLCLYFYFNLFIILLLSTITITHNLFHPVLYYQSFVLRFLITPLVSSHYFFFS